LTTFSSRRSFLCSGLIGLRAYSPAFSQNPTFTSNVKIVNISVKVRDSTGAIQSDLRKEDFSLEVDGRPQMIDYFSRPSDLPLNMALLIDKSDSMQTAFDGEVSASAIMIANILKDRKNRACLLSFSGELHLWRTLTSSIQLITSALDNLSRDHTNDGETDLFDAVASVSSNIMKPQYGHKAILLLSDGVDTGSKIDVDQAIAAAQDADVAIYSIQVFDSAQSSLISNDDLFGPNRVELLALQQRLQRKIELGTADLRLLSGRTGGTAYASKNSIPTICRQIQEELQHQYSLGFNLSPESGRPGSHTVRVTTNDPRLRVQTKDGYNLRD